MISWQKKKFEICVFCLVEKSVLIWLRDVTWWKCQSLAFNWQQQLKVPWTPTSTISTILHLWFFRFHFPKLDKKLISQFLCFYEICSLDEDSDMAKNALKMQCNSMDDVFISLYHAMERKQRLGMVEYDHDGLGTKRCIACDHLMVHYIHQNYQKFVSVMCWLFMLRVLMVMSSYWPYHHVATHSRCMNDSEQRPTA